MSRRFLDRAFSQAQYRGNHRQPRRGTTLPREGRQKKNTSEETDVISRIITAFNEKDFLKVLNLPLPGVDELGNAVWPYDPSHITKNYRQLCLLVHPDKNPGERARYAFQLLNRAYKALLDDDKRMEILKEATAVALDEKEKREASATVDEKIKINADKKLQKRKLSKLQSETFHSEILRQVKERKLQRTLKRQQMAGSRYTSKESDPLEETPAAEEKEASPIQGTEITAMGSVRGDIEKSDRAKIRQKLKSVHRAEEDVEELIMEGEVEDRSEEWQGAVFHRSKPPRRKPRFLF